MVAEAAFVTTPQRKRRSGAAPPPSNVAHIGGKLTLPIPARRRRSSGDLSAAVDGEASHTSVEYDDRVGSDHVLLMTPPKTNKDASFGDIPANTPRRKSCGPAPVDAVAPTTPRRRCTGVSAAAVGDTLDGGKTASRPSRCDQEATSRRRSVAAADAASPATTSNASPTTTSRRQSIATPTATPRRRSTGAASDAVPGTTACRRKSSGATSAKGATRQPSCNDKAIHEIVGWLLGALMAMRAPSKVGCIPVLLSDKKGQELELLGAMLRQQLAVKPEPPCTRAQLLEQLVSELRAYCGGEGPSYSCGPLPEACNDYGAQWFLAHVKRVIAWRGQWHRDCAQRRDSSQSSGPKRRRLSQGSEAGPAAGVQQKASKTASSRRRSKATQEEKTVDDTLASQSCEGCGRAADVYAWGPLNAPLCSMCAKARVPLMWALTRECIHALRCPAGLE